MADDWTPREVALFGLGQVGTMLALALRSRGVTERIIVAEPDRDALEAARARGVEPDAILDQDPHRIEADAVILAAPVPQIVELVGRIGPRLGPEQLLIDTGGAKAVVVEAMRSLPQHVRAIGGHPMAGTEIPGPAGADPERLAGAPFALTPARDDPVALARARRFVEAVGARAVVADAAEHDHIVARTSHLPHAVAYAVRRVAAAAGSAEAVSILSGTGLQGVTRLAASDPSMLAAFLDANREEVRLALHDLRVALDRIEEALMEGPASLSEELAAGSEVRS